MYLDITQIGNYCIKMIELWQKLGRNTGHHMYIDAGSGNSPTSLTFITTGSFERAFKMKITQIECGAVNRGVEGCLQYHTGVSGLISSFNYIGKVCNKILFD